ncbi:MAG TPA: hypothetical protein VIO64_16015 [Pseudobacteroides sp.]|uniref:hypothetical protein n=1 Tax=Pseudobacteroides sp. TaxID=1968840 RepID=UPI002F9327C9
MKLAKKITLSIVITIVISFICLLILKYYSYNVKERLTVFPLKTISLQIPEYEDFDYLKVAKNMYGNDFYMLFGKERSKLIEYMKKNNLVIKPGTYDIQESDRFEKVIKILKFEKKKD